MLAVTVQPFGFATFACSRYGPQRKSPDHWPVNAPGASAAAVLAGSRASGGASKPAGALGRARSRRRVAAVLRTLRRRVTLGQLAHHRHRQREVEVLRAAGDDRRGDAEQPALLVEQAAAARAARDRGRGLDRDEVAGVVVAQRRDDAGAERQLEAGGRAERDHRLADRDGAVVGERDGRCLEARGAQLADVARRVPQLERRRAHDLAVRHLDALGLAQHVAVRRQRVARDHDGAALAERQVVLVERANDPDARLEPLVELRRARALRPRGSGDRRRAERPQQRGPLVRDAAIRVRAIVISLAGRAGRRR